MENVAVSVVGAVVVEIWSFSSMFVIYWQSEIISYSAGSWTVFSEVGSTGEWPYTNCNTSTRCYQNCPLAVKCGTNFNRFPYGTMPLLRIEYSPLLIDQVNLVSHIAVGRTRNWDSIQPENMNSREEGHGEIWTGLLFFIFLTFFCAHLFDSTKHTTIDTVLRPFKDVPWIDPSTCLTSPLTLPTPAFSLHSLSVMYTDMLLTGMLLLITTWRFSLYLGWYGPERAYGWYIIVKGRGSFNCLCTHNPWNFFPWTHNII